jgi:glycerate-2-kinase
MQSPRDLLKAMFDAAIRRGAAGVCACHRIFRATPRGRLIVIGAGKASAADGEGRRRQLAR